MMNEGQEKAFENFKYQVIKFQEEVNYRISNENIETKDFPIFFYGDASIIIFNFLNNKVVNSSDEILKLANNLIEDFNNYLITNKIATV